MREIKTGEDAPQNPSHRSTQRPDEDHGPARSDGRQHVSEDINAQAQPESRPSRPDRRFKVFLENLADVAYETDASGNLTYVNKMAKTVTGLSKEELIGRPFLPLVEVADRARAAEGYERTMAGERTEFEMTLISGVVCHLKSEPLRDPDGRIVGVFGIARDISERRRAKEALVESEERFRTVADFTYDWEYWIDPEGNLLYVSPSCERVSGYPAGAFMDDPSLLYDIVHPDDRAQLRAHVETTSSPTEHLEFRIRTRAGETRWIGHVCQPVFREDGTWLGRRGSNRDITERKAAEESLRESHQLLDAILTASGVGIAYAKDRMIRWANEAMARIFRFSGEEDYLGKDTRVLYASEEEYQRIGRLIYGSPPGQVIEAEARFRHHDDDSPFFGAVKVNVLDPSDPSRGIIVNIVDVNVQKLAEENLSREKAFLKSIIDFNPYAIAVKDADGYHLSENQAYRDLFEGGPAEDFSIFEDPLLKELGLHEEVLKVREGEIVSLPEFWYNPKHGNPASRAAAVCIRSVLFPLLDPQGRVRNVVVMIEDMTARKQAEDALVASEDRYLVLTNHIADGVSIYQDGTAVFVNPAFASMLGYTVEELVGKDPVELMNEDYRDAFRRMVRSYEKGVPKEPFECVCLHHDGKQVWTEAYHDVIQWQSKPALLCTVRDVTEQKLRAMAMEEEREHLHRENVKLRASIKERYRFGEIVGKSAGMQEVYELIMRAAGSNGHVIIQGESGTGKELIARTIHDMSDRKEAPFVPVNCGAVPETLFESEFFGHEKGAFTGAQVAKHGFFDLARGGTLFLDEIGELTLNMQAKLLRAIDGGGFVAVGGRQLRQAEARIVAATNRDLGDMVRRGLFREDFFYRLHVIPISVPPLRNRKEDIPLLVDHFLKIHDSEGNRQTLSGGVLERLYDHHWPGNVRELQNLLQRYISLNRLDFITPGGSGQTPSPQVPAEVPVGRSGTLREILAHVEREVLSKALEENRWHRGRAARSLGIPERTLYRKLKQHRIH